MTQASVSLAAALRVAQTRHGVDPAIEPDRATAIVADLVATAEGTTGPRVVAIRAALHALPTVEPGAPDIRDRLRAAVVDTVPDGDGQAITEAVDAVLAVAESRPRAAGWDDRPRHPRRSWQVAAVAIAAMAGVAVGIRALTTDADEDPGRTAGTSTSTTAEPTTATPTTSDPSPSSTSVPSPSDATTPREPVVVAAFDPVAEGDFVVERTWTASADTGLLVARVRLAGVDGGRASGVHREVPPPGLADPPDVRWQPAPTDTVDAVAVYTQVDVAAGAGHEIRYELPLPEGVEVSTAAMRAWYESWVPLAQQAQSPFGDPSPLPPPQVSIVD